MRASTVDVDPHLAAAADADRRFAVEAGVMQLIQAAYDNLQLIDLPKHAFTPAALVTLEALMRDMSAFLALPQAITATALYVRASEIETKDFGVWSTHIKDRHPFSPLVKHHADIVVEALKPSVKPFMARKVKDRLRNFIGKTGAGEF